MNPHMKSQTLFGAAHGAQGWRTRLPHWRVAAVIAAAVAVAMLAALLLIALMGVPVGDALAAFADGAWGSPYAIGASINRSLAFALVGTGFVIANRAKLTNVGGEGQIAIGGIVATALSLYGGCSHLPLGLSFIAVWLLYWCVQSEALLRQPMSNAATLPESLEIPDLTKLPAIFAASGMNLNIGLPVSVALAFASAILLTRTRFGLSLRAAGLNAIAAKRAGLPIASSIVGALALAGAFSGLAGALMLQGDQYSLKAGFSSGYGFDGLVVGLLARGSITGVFAAALLFGFLRSAAPRSRTGRFSANGRAR